MRQLRISHEALSVLRAHGELTYPCECCGVLLGHPEPDGWRVVATVEAENVRTDSPRNRYEIAPAELIRIERAARDRGLQIAGFYHSHPDQPARWSMTDLAHAHWIGSIYVITEVAQGQAAETNAYFLGGQAEDNKQFEQAAIEISG